MTEKSPPSDRDDLHALLEDAPYIDDAGFANRVMGALPARRASRAIAYAVVPSFATLGCVLAYVLGRRPLVTHGAVLPLSAVMTWSFLSAAVALILVAWATLLTADE